MEQIQVKSVYIIKKNVLFSSNLNAGWQIIMYSGKISTLKILRVSVLLIRYYYLK